MFDWAKNFSDWLVYGVFGFKSSSHLGKALNFFFYDSIKVAVLLFTIVFLMGIVNSYFPVERIRYFLNKKKFYGFEYILASIFGAITPFCSCSSVPLFIGFVQGGIPLGITFAFLITSPLVNEVAVALFIGIFGLKVALLYAGTGILLGTLGGWVLSKFNLEPLLADWVRDNLARPKSKNIKSLHCIEEDSKKFSERLPDILKNAFDVLKGLLIFIAIGIGIGAGMHGFVPENFFTQFLGKGDWWTVPLAVILAVPMYANAAAIVPTVQVFVAKGVPLGTAMAFMMATVGLSLPEATLLKKVMTIKLILIYFGTVTFFIIISGYIFNMLLL